MDGARAALVLRDNLRNRTRIERAYLKALGDARQEVVIANAYFLPGARMRWALKLPAAALASGGRWEAMINGTTDTGIPLAAPAR